MSKKEYNDDDGRTIADMNIEGMPWNNGQNRFFGGLSRNIRFRKPKPKNNENTEAENNVQIDEEYSSKETKTLVLNALLAVLLIGAVFAVAGFLFIEFCIHIWLK